MSAAAECERCGDTGWIVRHHYVCDCRSGDFAWAKWEGMSIEEYDRRAGGAVAPQVEDTRDD